MYKSKHITTKLNEKQFLSRLKTFCREKTLFDKGYNNEDVFVTKRKNNRLWICKHSAVVGRSGGYANDCIYVRYSTNKSGYIDVEYRFGKLLLFVIPFIISLHTKTTINATVATTFPTMLSYRVWI